MFSDSAAVHVSAACEVQTHTHTHTHTHTPPPHTNTDELIQAIRQDIAVASEKLEEPSMKELAVQLDDHLRTKHTH